MNVEILGSRVSIDESYISSAPAAIRAQLGEYGRGERRTFELDVSFPSGLTGAVMRAMTRIPYGETRTYGELASELETAPIAVGQACGRNPVPVIVPCHRIVASDGSLGGYSGGDGIPTKRRLLVHEAETA